MQMLSRVIPNLKGLIVIDNIWKLPRSIFNEVSGFQNFLSIYTKDAFLIA